ncbi:PREDICTED: class II histocompatibility antigen, M beta 1 chain-like [Nipponia nippon]|uniref:class II histocompatibility antigen, M beta 1 chain-like n=1 Tax=Nipponia nippon TaxID=128390 RepID=UPI0005113CEA|nr:PREDICTED: class II histocompatibility antigen, M beta 1 chain-like [Nipponia nippon]
MKGRDVTAAVASPLPDPGVGLDPPPQVRIVPVPLPNTPNAVLLTCHVWGFYPAEVTVLWLHNGDVVATGDTAKLLPNGDWTYQTQVTLTVTAKAGDTFTCSVQHASLNRPLRKRWGPGLSPGLTVKVAVAAVTMTLGLVVFAAGTFSYCRQVLVLDLVPVLVLLHVLDLVLDLVPVLVLLHVPDLVPILLLGLDLVLVLILVLVPVLVPPRPPVTM